MGRPPSGQTLVLLGPGAAGDLSMGQVAGAGGLGLDGVVFGLAVGVGWRRRPRHSVPNSLEPRWRRRRKALGSTGASTLHRIDVLPLSSYTLVDSFTQYDRPVSSWLGL